MPTAPDLDQNVVRLPSATTHRRGEFSLRLYLLLRSRYVPRALALVGLVGSALAALFALTRMLFPAFIAAAFAAVRTLPPVVLVLLALVLAPILLLELVLGLWLLVKGVRTDREVTA